MFRFFVRQRPASRLGRRTSARSRYGTVRLHDYTLIGEQLEDRRLLSVTAAIDQHLLDLIDQYAPAFYNSAWNLNLEQFKAWIATIARAEGGAGGYGAHSQGAPGSDVFAHTGNSSFTFSTGIGPFQLDRGGDDNWGTWPTIDKLDPAKAVQSVMKEHANHFSAGSTLQNFADASPWYALNPNYGGDVSGQWLAVTDTSWDSSKNGNVALGWNGVETQLAGNASDPKFRYADNVVNVGAKTWNIDQIDNLYTDTGKRVLFTGQHETWLVTARNWSGTQLFRYYYTYDTSSKIEVWVLDNAGAAQNALSYVIAREYGTGPFPEHRSTAGDTLSAAALTLVTPVSPGVTIIVHGANTDVSGWVTEMAGAITNRLPGTASNWTFSVTDTSGTLRVEAGLDSGSLDRFWDSYNGQSIIKLDWSALAHYLDPNPLHWLAPIYSTADVSSAVSSYLLTTRVNGKSWLDVPVHLIGHSRGASLVGALAEELGKAGVWVDQVTYLDPFPVPGDYGFSSSAPILSEQVTENVTFADNYFQFASFPVPPWGYHVEGAHEQPLNGLIGGYSDLPWEFAPAHSNMHLWYHGTVDTIGNISDGSVDDFDPEAFGWYSSSFAPRTTSGYYSSQNGGGARPRDGLSIMLDPLGGFRQSVAATLPAWPNVVDLKFESPTAQLTVGDPLFVSYWFQDHDSNATATFYLDQDKDPYNGNEATIATKFEQSTGSGNATHVQQQGLLTDNAQPGTTYFLGARISDGTHTRYSYASGTVTFVANRPPSIGSFYGTPNPLSQGSNLILTASGVTDPDGNVTAVEFYRESNGQSGLQPGSGGDTFLGNGVQGGTSWAWSGFTTGFPLGTSTFYARARDDGSAWSAAWLTTVTITSQPGNIVQWDGGPSGTGTSWNTAANWVGDVLPGANDDATIGAAFAGITITSAGNVTVHAVSSQAALLITSGTFTIAGPSTVVRPLTLNSGTVLNVLVGAVFDVQANGTAISGAGTINNAGLFRKASGNGTTTVSARFNNTGTVEVDSGNLTLSGSGSSISAHYEFANGGRLNISSLASQGAITANGNGVLSAGGSVAASTTAAFNSSTFTNGAVLEIGSLNVASGATLSLNMTGSQQVKMVNGYLHGAGTIVNLGNFAMTGGEIGADNSGTFVNQGTFIWSGGSVRGTGGLRNESQFVITGNVTIARGSFLTNAGTIQQIGESTTLRFGGDPGTNPGTIATLNNLAGALYEVQGNNAGLTGQRYFFEINEDAGIFNNAGTFRKSADSATASANDHINFNNTGTVEVDSGTLTLGAGSSLAAHYELANGARLNANLAWQGESTVDGNGVLRAGGSVPATMTAEFNGSKFTNGAALEMGSLSVAGNATLTLNMPASQPAKLVGGYLHGTGTTVNLGSFAFTGGQIGGDGTGVVVNQGNFAWTTGDVKGRLLNQSGNFTILASGSESNKILAGGNLTNAGVITQIGDSTVRFGGYGSTGSTAILINLAGAVYNFQGNASFQPGYDSPFYNARGAINNAGLFRKSAGTGTSSMGSFNSFNNTGTVAVDSGTLTFGTASPHLTVAANNKSKSYGQEFTAFTGTITGLQNGDTVSPSYASAGAPTSAPVQASPYPISTTIFDPSNTLGNYTVTIRAGNLTVSPAALTVTADNMSRMYGDPNPTFTASFSGFQNGETLATSGVSGGPSLTCTATPTSPVGNYTIVAAPSTLAATNYSFVFVNGTLSITAASVRVTALDPTRTGFMVQLSRDLDASALNLYDQGGVLGAADLTLTGTATGSVRGSLIVDPGLRKITFMKSGGTLAPDIYSVTLKSGASAFKDTLGNLLDGNLDGTAGDDFIGNFTVDAPAPNSVTLSVPDFTRGYGQAVHVPANTNTGLPISITNATGVGNVSFTLLYNPALLTIWGATLGPNITGNLTLNISTPGVAQISVANGAPLSSVSGSQTLVSLTASVPSDAPYSSKHILDIANLHVFDTSSTPAELSSFDDDGIHVAAFLGDANGSQSYNSPDATLVQRIIIGTNTGFSAYQLADPYLIADITNNGAVQSNDVTLIQRAIVGTYGLIPAPSGLPASSAGGPDPLVYIPKDLTGAVGEAIIVPVNLLATERGGITLGGADLAIAYDPNRFQLTNTEIGRLLVGFGLTANSSTPGLVRLSLSAGAALDLPFGAAGTLASLQFTILSGAGAASSMNLLATSGALQTALYDDGGRALTLQPAPGNSDDDAVDGQVTIAPLTSQAWAEAVDVVLSASDAEAIL